jgi:hypothetical protein
MEKLKPLGPVIQVCSVCNKVDVYLGDGHDCGQEIERQRSMEQTN